MHNSVHKSNFSGARLSPTTHPKVQNRKNEKSNLPSKRASNTTSTKHGW